MQNKATPTFYSWLAFTLYPERGFLMLSNSEIDMLQQGLDALESSASHEGLMGMMLGTMLAPDKESRDRLMEERRIEMEQKKTEQQRLRERIILLKAKLIQMKDGCEVEAIIAQTMPTKAETR